MGGHDEVQCVADKRVVSRRTAARLAGFEVVEQRTGERAGQEIRPGKRRDDGDETPASARDEDRGQHEPDCKRERDRKEDLRLEERLQG